MKAIGLYIYRLMRKPLSILVIMVAVLAIVTVTAFTQNAKTPPPPMQSVACDSRLEWNTTKGVTRDQAMTPPERSTGVIPSAAIPSLPTVASNYTFSNATRVITTNVPAVSANRLSATNGTFKLSSASVLTPWFGNQTLTATTGRIWLNNAAASTTVVGVGTGTGAGAPTINGTLQVDAGTFGYGSGNNTMAIGAAGALVIGGASATVNIFGVVSFTTGATFTMTAGNFNVDPQAANNLGATTNIVMFNSINVAFTGVH